MTDDVRKLLGGYATGTLTEAERSELFRAALQDEQLFAALADEQALKELLDDSAARAELLQACEQPHRASVWRWMAPLGALSAATLVAVMTFQFYRATPEPPATTAMSAKLEAPRTEPAPPAPVAQVQTPQAVPEKTKPKAKVMRTPPSPAKETAEEPRVGLTAERVEIAPAPAPMVAQEELKASPRMADRAAGAMAYTVARKAAAPSIDYSILKQTASGDFVTVANDTVFGKEDRIRIKLHLAGPGTLELLQRGNVVASQTLATRQDQVLPAEGAIALSSGSTLQLVVQPIPSTMQAFSPGAQPQNLPAAPRTITIQLRTE